MPEYLKTYVRTVDGFNRRVGRTTMYLIFAMMGILLYSSVSKAWLLPSLWTLEMAQFVMAAYYLLGGAYSLQLDSHVRMDLVYGRWTARTRAAVDAITILMLFVYLGFLLYGGVSSTAYALKYGETSYSSWAPYMAPIKIVMTIGIALTLLQATSIFIKDLARAMGRPIA
ncbi:MAG: TRAP transporter small permease subunit [Sinorhizobium meliloti]|jgi:TRAP-type mannitol/chloroaromatic compound transport system permease small subunit|uniref:TRAP transporter small permease subunit n=1 Tax=Sinorhizobium TaxID=28105 RepID=UPI000369138F|nr:MULTISPECIES: TRAP transporter small permease subunit [Sinorhizobium]PND23539.1 C4-dicarboxylate ABC transporter permease [Ensifer sp. MMN_5]MBL3684587.1 TRAP transporter small permease subunit [Sinorhizobium meliloti]MCG5482414.1 TRAP transporter small permease subunit [Sinorhizobium meliloti]PND28852.1 C4-dicarboxylate ABC transporter permease [Sinorhizobium sp. M4_45]RVP98986.1 TRAP transporter small permease subunit [Sinorhizobium meliloti]